MMDLGEFAIVLRPSKRVSRNNTWKISALTYYWVTTCLTEFEVGDTNNMTG